MTITVLVVDDQPLMRAALCTALHAVREDLTVLPANSLEDASRQIKVSTPPDLTVLDLHLPDACGTAALDAFRRQHPGLRIVAMIERPDPAIAQACRKAGNVSLTTKTACMDSIIDCLRATLAGQVHIDCDTPAAVPLMAELPPAALASAAAPMRSGAPAAVPAPATPPAPTPVPAVHAAPQTVTGRWLSDGRVQTLTRPVCAAEPSPAESTPGGELREHHDGRHLGLTERQRCVLKLMMMGLPNKAICRELHLAEGTVKVHVSAVLRALGVACRAQVAIAALRSGIVMDEIVIP